jgi:hypothetical protein
MKNTPSLAKKGCVSLAIGGFDAALPSTFSVTTCTKHKLKVLKVTIKLSNTFDSANVFEYEHELFEPSNTENFSHEIAQINFHVLSIENSWFKFTFPLYNSISISLSFRGSQ